MPELPEVETVVRGLREILIGRTITKVETHAPASSITIGKSFRSKSFEKLLVDRRVINIRRRGKNILMHLSGDLTLWIHLKMTGRFRYQPIDSPCHRHDLVLIDLDTTPKNGYHLRFNDYRRFGRLRLFDNEELWQQPGLSKLGPEPLDIARKDFVSLCRRRPRMFKPALLDQSFLAGIGNIYADESLYFAKIHPRRLTTSVSLKKLVSLHSNIRRILRRAIRLMGSSVDTFSGLDGQPGRFQSYLKVYGQQGCRCAVCKRIIVREKIGSRSAHYCPGCQRIF